MEKNFDDWNKNKKDLHYRKSNNTRFREGEIWWCAAGINIGHEIDGKHDAFERPFYILKKCSETMFIGIPCTSSSKKGLYIYHLDTNRLDFILNFSQIKTLSSKRLLRKVSTVLFRYERDIREKFIEYLKRKSAR